MKVFSAPVKAILMAGLAMGLAFNAHSEYVVNGSASPSAGGNCFILTPVLQLQAGSVWYDRLITLDADFDMTFEVYLGALDIGADGIAFVLQPIGNTALGGYGGGLGYLGLSPSVAVEFDTWRNIDDPSYDHIAVLKNGNVNSHIAGPVPATPTLANIDDGAWHNVRITWDAATKTLRIYFDDALRLTYTDDIVASTFGGNPAVYWGFTGATGGGSNLQQFCAGDLNFQPLALTPLSPWALAIALFLILTATLFRHKKNL